MDAAQHVVKILSTMVCGKEKEHLKELILMISEARMFNF